MATRRRRLPSLRDTGRSYVRDTLRARLRSRGIERYRRSRAAGPSLAVALAVALALVAAMLWLRSAP